ncbi:hypothetical protein AAFC00_005393 [Neodothiora populina]
MTRATKAVHRKQSAHPQRARVDMDQPEPSWELVQHTTAQDDAADPISPLRDMADRVGREVDHFAETLDKFNNRLHDEDAYGAAYELTVEYKAYANSVINKLKKQHSARRLHSKKNDFGKRCRESHTSLPGTSIYPRDEDEQLDGGDPLHTIKYWQTESDTWELFRLMLELRYRPNSEQAQHERKAKLAQSAPTNRYTTPSALWDNFTLNDDQARERHLVLKWLQETAAHGDSDELDGTSPDSNQDAGVWVNGWMETREKIKGAKRARFLPADNAAGLDIRCSDTNEPLVSQLDPDAPSRQRGVLEKKDALSERSLWISCWSMLRRGTPWAEVCEWCSVRNQDWRAVSLGAAVNSPQDIPIPGYSAGTLWRHTCYTLATKQGTDEYEAAVYGLMSGHLDSVRKVCKTWDDHLYAHYNSLLLNKFDLYLHEKLPDRVTTAYVPTPDSFNTNITIDLMEKLQGDPATSSEAGQPMKLLQASLIANSFENLCQGLSSAITSAAWYRSQHRSAATENRRETAIANDFDALRIATHMLIMLREFYPPLSADTAETVAMDNIVAAYIHFLSAVGKRDLAPLYASKMAPARAKASLAQVLSMVDHVQDKVSFIKLMGVYGLDPMAVLIEQSRYLVRNLTLERDLNEAHLQIVEETTDTVYPGQRIKLDFTSAATGSETLADHLIVFYLVEGHWDVTFSTLAYACRKLLLHGYFLEASRLVQKLPFESLSATKSRSVLGRAVNVMDREDILSFQDDAGAAATLRVLQRQSQAYYELTILVRAIAALENWRRMEHEHMSKIPQPTSAPSKLKRAFEDTCNTLEPVFTGILLRAKDDKEESELSQIRAHYLPEVVLAYNAALCAAAHLKSRDYFMNAMDLAAVVADNKTGLAVAIMAAGRMTEVVTAFAHTSEHMLKLNEIGTKPRREKKSKTGGNLAIWEIGG